MQMSGINLSGPSSFGIQDMYGFRLPDVSRSKIGNQSMYEYLNFLKSDFTTVDQIATRATTLTIGSSGEPATIATIKVQPIPNYSIVDITEDGITYNAIRIDPITYTNDQGEEVTEPVKVYTKKEDVPTVVLQIPANESVTVSVDENTKVTTIKVNKAISVQKAPTSIEPVEMTTDANGNQTGTVTTYENTKSSQYNTIIANVAQYYTGIDIQAASLNLPSPERVFFETQSMADMLNSFTTEDKTGFGTTATGAVITLGNAQSPLMINASSITSTALQNFVVEQLGNDIKGALNVSTDVTSAANNGGVVHGPFNYKMTILGKPILLASEEADGATHQDYIICNSDGSNGYSVGLTLGNDVKTTYLNGSSVSIASQSTIDMVSASNITITTNGTTDRTLTLNVGQILDGTGAPLTNFIRNAVTTFNNFGTTATGAVTLGNASRALTIQASSITDGTGTPLANFIDKVDSVATNSTRTVTVGTSGRQLILNGSVIGLLTGGYSLTIYNSSNGMLFRNNNTSNYLQISEDSSTAGQWNIFSVNPDGNSSIKVPSLLADDLQTTSIATNVTSAITIGTSAQTLTLNGRSILDGTGTPLTNFIRNAVTTFNNFGTTATGAVTVGSLNSTLTLNSNTNGTSIISTTYSLGVNGLGASITSSAFSGTNSTILIRETAKGIWAVNGSLSNLNKIVFACDIEAPNLTSSNPATASNFGTTATSPVTVGNMSQVTNITGSTIYIGSV